MSPRVISLGPEWAGDPVHWGRIVQTGGEELASPMLMATAATGAGGAAARRVQLDVGSLSRGACAARFESALNKLAGVRAAVNFATGRRNFPPAGSDNCFGTPRLSDQPKVAVSRNMSVNEVEGGSGWCVHPGAGWPCAAVRSPSRRARRRYGPVRSLGAATTAPRRPRRRRRAGVGRRRTFARAMP